LLLCRACCDIREHVAPPVPPNSRHFSDVFPGASLTDCNPFAASQAGLVNSLNDAISGDISAFSSLLRA